MSIRKIGIFLAFLVLFFLIFIAGLLVFKKELFRKDSGEGIAETNSLKEGSNFIKYSWDKSRMGWINKTSGDPKAEAISDIASIEFSKELCQRKVNPVCGFQEGGGGFTNVSAVVAYALSLLNDRVWVNMDLREGGYFSLAPNERLFLNFNPTVPVRFIYEDGDKYTFSLPSPGFSLGWGVDPETKGLTVFIGEKSQGDGEWYDYQIRNSLEKITNADATYNLKYQERFKNLWYSGDYIHALKPILP